MPHVPLVLVLSALLYWAAGIFFSVATLDSFSSRLGLFGLADELHELPHTYVGWMMHWMNLRGTAKAAAKNGLTIPM